MPFAEDVGNETEKETDLPDARLHGNPGDIGRVGAQGAGW